MKKVLLTLIGGSSAGTKPVATSILSAVLKQKGHEVVLFDTTFMDLGFMLDGEISDSLMMFKPVNWSEYNLTRDKSIDAEQEFLKFIKREEPDLIAASSFSDMYRYTIDFLRFAREHSDIPIIIGGIHTTLLPEEVIKEDCIDALCIGEGEEALCEYVDALDGKHVTRTDIKNLWIKQNGKIFKNPIRELVEPDSLPFFDYSIYDQRQFFRPYQGKVYRSGDYQDKRGCPRKCTYCAYSIINSTIYPSGRVKYYSAERFVEEAKYLTQTYNLGFFKIFSEDIFLRKTDNLAKMSELYAKKVSVPFTTSAHPLTITEEKAKMLKKMNCVSISIALECGNQHYREYVLKRKYTNEQFGKSIRILQDQGIRAVSLNMIGLPRESRKMIFETVEVNRKVKPDHADFGCFFPFRSTPLGDLAIADGFVSPENVARSRSSHGGSILRMPQIEAAEVEGIMKMHSFYLQYPKVFWPVFRFCERNGGGRDLLYYFLKLLDYGLRKIGIR